MTFAKMPRAGSFCIKLISIFLIPTFILSNIAYAAPTTDSAKVSSPNLTVTNPESIVIPREFGLVKTKFTGKDDRLVIHIQDAHCNYEAQSNIVKILENLHKNYNVNLVSVEGADGVIDTSWFKAFPDDEVRKEVADYFMKKGEITGPEFLSITTDYNIKLFGAETRSYYIDNLNAFTSSYPLKEQTEKYLNSIRSALNRLKTYIYSEDLKLMDAKYQDYDAKKLQFNDYVKFLQVEAEKAKINLRAYENFFKLVSVLVYEKKIDFTVTDKERSALIDSLSKAISKEALTELVNKSLEFKTGKISSADYYAYLKKLAIDNDTDLAKDYPNLYNYIIYNSVYSKIENEKLFNDIKKLEGDIKEKLFTTDDQRTLEKLSRHIDILIGLVNIKLLNGDYEYFEANKAEFEHGIFSDFLKKKTIQYGLAYEMDDPNDAVAKALPKLEDFYSIAVKRDKALVDNTLGQMGKDKARVAVLVTGGFHSEGMSKLLEKQGVSYMVICPSITKDLPTPYIQILTNQKTPLSDILVTPVHASEGQDAVKIDTLAPPLRTSIMAMKRSDREKYIASLDKATAAGLEVKLEELEPDFLSACIMGRTEDLKVNGVVIWRINIPGYIRTRAEKVGLSKLDSGYIVDDLIRQTETRCSKLNMPSSAKKAYIAALRAQLPKAVADSFAKRIKDETDRQAAQKGSAVVSRTSPGKSGSNAVLTLSQAGTFGEAVAAGYDSGSVRLEVMSEVAPGFQFVTHKNLVELCDERGLPTNVHPGRGGYVDGVSRGKLQAHIDRFIYDGLSESERRVIAEHEFAHLAIFNVEEAVQAGMAKNDIIAKYGTKAYAIWEAWVKAGKSVDEAQENFVNGLSGCDVISTGISAKIANLAAEKRLRNMREAIAKNDVVAMEKILLRDRLYGSAAADEIKRLKGTVGAEDYASFIKQTITRRYNIDRSNATLIKTPYEGYDVIIISSTTPDEADYQQGLLDRAFNGVRTRNGDLANKVCVLSVLDESEGGQVLGQVNTWLRAKEAFELWAKKNGVANTNLDDVLDQNKARIGIYHNGGKGERFSPGSQGYGNSRGAQNFRNPVSAPSGVVDDANLILGVVMSTAPIAMSMPDERRVDTYWANQVAFGTIDLANIQRTNYAFDKLVVRVPKNAKRKDLFDYGTAIIDKLGRIVKFLANKVLTKKDSGTGKYVENPDYAKELKELTDSPKGSYDYGSFSMSKELHKATINYWTEIRKNQAVITGKGMAGLARDIDPAFVQIIVPIMSGLRAVPALPTAADLDTAPDKNASLETAYGAIISAMDKEYAAAVDKVYKKSKDAVLETVEMMIRYSAIFSDISKVVGNIDLGENSHWFAFKRILDMANNRLLMLSDILGKNIEIEPSGNIAETQVTADDMIKAEDARRMFGITADSVCVFEVNGKVITLSSEQVKKGWKGEGVEIKGSIMQGKCVLLPGSRIINSFIHDSQGCIIAENSYVESCAAPAIVSNNSILIKAVDVAAINADKEIVADAFRPDIHDRRFRDGQTRMRAPIGYDPKPADKELAAKMSDGVKFGDNEYSFQQIRNMKCNRTANDVIENNVRQDVKDVLARSTTRYAKAKPLSFGTSGLRALNEKMTDMEVYINVGGFVDYLVSIGDIKRGDTIKLAGDFRPTTERIARATIKAILDKDCSVEYKGRISTPAISLAGMSNGRASIMITASHNPPDQNGEKFNRTKKEILKKEEAGILANVAVNRVAVYTTVQDAFLFDENTGMFKITSDLSAVDSIIKAVNDDARQAYIKRYSDAFGRILEGVDVVYYRHTSVAKRLLPEVFSGVGLNVDDAGDEDETKTFRALDTENITKEIKDIIRHLAWEHKNNPKYGKVPFAIVTADGDGDRPGLFYVSKDADTEEGMEIEYIPGDKLGVLASLFLKPDLAAVPYTANDFALARLTASDIGAEVVRPLVGSPYCIEKLEAARNTRSKRLFFEVNGGMGTDSIWDIRAAIKEALGKDMGGSLAALPTRDSALPLICALIMAKKFGSVQALVDDTFKGDYKGSTQSGLVEDKNADVDPVFGRYVTATGKAIFESLAPKDSSITEVVFEAGVVKCLKAGVLVTADPVTKAYMNGVAAKLKQYFTDARGFDRITKLSFYGDNGTLVYFSNNIRVTLRPSGNAAQFRFQTLALTQADADKIVGMKFDIMKGIIESVTGPGIAPTSVSAVNRATPGIYGVTPGADSLAVVSSTINVEASLDALFNNPESETLRMFQTEVNNYLKSYSQITNKDEFKRYLILAASRALDLEDVSVSRSLQIMAGQALAIISLIEDRVPGADKVHLNINPTEMLKSKDKDRGLSYIDAQSVIDSGIGIADAEGAAQGMYWRGVEGITKLGANISAEAIYDREKFESQSPKMVMYVMLHVGGYHTTVFLHDYIPGSIQHTSTGAGHMQNDAMDIKYVVSGRGLQLNKTDTSISFQNLSSGAWAVAYPYNVDEIVNFGGLIFKDFSFKAPGVAPRPQIIAVPYIAVTINNQETFVVNGMTVLPLISSATLASAGNVSIRDLYAYSDQERYMNRPKEIGSTEKPVIVTPDQVARAAAEAKLAEMRRANMPVQVKPAFNLAAWGQKLLGNSRIAARHGLNTPEERIAWARKNGILKPEAPDTEGAKGVVAEEWYGASTDIEVNGIAMPLPAEMRPEITAKELDSAATLSLQSHNFDETFVALEDGEVFLGLKSDISDSALLRALITGKVEDILNRVAIRKGDVMFVPAGTLHAYGVVDLQELKKVTAEQDRTGTNSFSDRLKLEDRAGKVKSADVRRNLASVIEAMMPQTMPADESGYAKLTGEILVKVKTELEAKYGYTKDEAESAVRQGKDALTMSLDKINKNISSIKKVAENPDSFKIPNMKVAASETGKSAHELLSTIPGFTWERYTIEKGDTISMGQLARLSLNRLVVESGEVEVVDKDTGEVKALMSPGEAYIIEPRENKKYNLVAVNGAAVVYSDYVPSHAGELLVTESYQAMRREIERQDRKAFTMWVPQTMYNGDSFKAEADMIKQASGNLVTLRQYTSIDQIRSDDIANDVIVSLDSEVGNFPAKMLSSSRILPVSASYINQLKSNGRIMGHVREIETIGVILGNTKPEDIRDKTSRAMDLFSLMNRRTKEVISMSDLTALLGMGPDAIDTRLKKLKEMLPLIIPVDPNEIDAAVKSRRQALWSA